jgi:hypothetical protein
MSHTSSTSSGLYLFRGSYKTWYRLNEDVVQFLHPFTFSTFPQWWNIFVEVFQFIQYLSFGFEAFTAGTTFGYYFSIPRAFLKFGRSSYIALFWTIMAVNILSLYILIYNSLTLKTCGMWNTPPQTVLEISDRPQATQEPNLDAPAETVGEPRDPHCLSAHVSHQHAQCCVF